MISTPGVHFFGSKQASNSTESCSDFTIFCSSNAGRVHAILSAQGAPKFRKFCNSFAGFSHKICVISTPRLIFRVWTHNRPGRELKCYHVCCAAHAGREKFSNSVRMARRNSGSFAILSRNFCANFTESRRQTRTFSDINKILTSLKAEATLRDLSTRKLAECTKFFLRRARRKARNSIKFAIRSQDFRIIFA